MTLSVKELVIGIVGLGIGVGGGGALTNLYSFSKPVWAQTIGETSAKYTSDAQWRFLYLLGSKVFEYLSKNPEAKKKESETGVKDKASVIDWLKDKFNLNKSEIKDDWKGFKDLCVGALKNENEIVWGKVILRESRLCFMGEPWLAKKNDNDDPQSKNSHITLQLRNAGENGVLGRLQTDKTQNDSESTPETSPYKDLEAFKDNNWTKYNYQLWEGFKSDKGKDIADIDSTSDSDFKSKWEEWYNLETTYTDTENTKVLKTLLSTSTKSS